MKGIDLKKNKWRSNGNQDGPMHANLFVGYVLHQTFKQYEYIWRFVFTNKFDKQSLYSTCMNLCFCHTVFYFLTIYIDCHPQIPAEETVKEGRNAHPGYDLNTILFSASFISDSDYLYMLSYSTLHCMSNRAIAKHIYVHL